MQNNLKVVHVCKVCGKVLVSAILESGQIPFSVHCNVVNSGGCSGVMEQKNIACEQNVLITHVWRRASHDELSSFQTAGRVHSQSGGLFLYELRRVGKLTMRAFYKELESAKTFPTSESVLGTKRDRPKWLRWLSTGS